jgi:hypothetical protein
MEMNGQIHALAALGVGKQRSLFIEQKAGWAKEL